MKLCKDCKHYRPDTTLGIRALGFASFDRCDRAEYVYQRTLKLVRGESKRMAFCDMLRGDESRCGVEGKGFEPRPTKRWWPLVSA